MQDTKGMGQTNKRSAKTRAIIQDVMEITGYSESMIEKVINGNRENELIMNTYMELLETGNEKKNELKMALGVLVPFPSKNDTSKKSQVI